MDKKTAIINIDSEGIRTIASKRLVPNTSAIDHSATLPYLCKKKK